MTQLEFLTYCKLYPSQVNVWYTDTAPYTIQGLSVPVLDLNLADNTPFLTQVERVTLPLPNGSTITLDITQISVNSVNTTGGGLISFFLLLTSPSITSGITSSNVAAGSISFSPAINGIIFSASPYNTIGGTVQNSRTSTYIMESDRFTIGIPGNPGYTGPTNISQLLSYSASRADIQDSMYSSTGWINGRYNGTETNIYDNLVIPAINGRTFEAAVFPVSASDTQIRFQQSGSQIVYKDYFFTGTGDVPGFNKKPSNFLLQTSISAFDGTIFVDTTPFISINPFEVGDLISFQGKSEVCRVRAVAKFNDTTLTLLVDRGVFGIQDSVNSGVGVFETAQTQIYEISGNRVQGVPRGKVLVKETGDILTLDSLGSIINVV
jgi:hypothetical protein